MSVTSTTSLVKATATASQVLFSISDIEFFTTSEIIVYKDGVLQSSGFTVSVANQDVTFNTAMVGGELLVFQRVLPKTQEVAYTVQGKFPAASHEEALDRAVMLLQELDEVNQRTLKIPVTNTVSSFSGELPDPGLAANFGLHLRNKADGSGFEYIAVSTDAIADPLTTEGDLLVQGSSAAQRLGIGTNGQILTVTNGEAAWESIASPPNFIINGDMNIWQENTTFATVTADAPTADMWNLLMTRGEYTATNSRSTDVPTVAQAGRLLNYSHLVTTTTEETALATTDQLSVVTKLEGYNMLPTVGQIVTLSFWVKSSVSGTYVVWLASGSNDRNYPVTYTIDATNTWEQKTITLTMDDQAVGTWDTTNGIGLTLGWALSMGSSFDGTNATWASSNVRSVSTATNTWMTTAGATFRLTGVELVLGSVGGVAQPRSFHEDLRLAQRYYAKSWDYATAVGTATTAGARRIEIQPGPTSTYSCEVPIIFPVTMRTAPTIAGYAPSTGTINLVDMASGTEIPAIDYISTDSARITASNTPGTSASRTLSFHYTTNARL